MFFEKYECDIASCADDNTPHTYDSDLYTVLYKLKNYGDNCHLLVTTEKSVSVTTDGSSVTNKKEQKLIGIKFDSSLLRRSHYKSL